jgi:hypothetical protein
LRTPWAENRAIPRGVAALLESLCFYGRAQEWPVFSESEWKAALDYFDRNPLTLLLRLPGSVHTTNLARNQERVRRTKQAYWDVSAALGGANIEFAVLKGFANWERFTPDPALRMQYDLDLFCPHAAVEARDTLTRQLGYESVQGACRSSAGAGPQDRLAVAG